MIDVIYEVKKADQRYDIIHEIDKANPYHDERGRFTTASGGIAHATMTNGATSLANAPGKSGAHESNSFGNSDTKTFASAVGAARESCTEDSRWRVTAHTEQELNEDYGGAKLQEAVGVSLSLLRKRKILLHLEN